MRLKAIINGKEYNIVQGEAFAEEYNETLDSGSIILEPTSEKLDIKPYDDVYIVSESDTFNGQETTAFNDTSCEYNPSVEISQEPSAVKIQTDLGGALYNLATTATLTDNIITQISSIQTGTLEMTLSCNYIWYGWDSDNEVWIVNEVTETKTYTSSEVITSDNVSSITMTTTSAGVFLPSSFTLTNGVATFEFEYSVEGEIVITATPSALEAEAVFTETFAQTNSYTYYKHMLVDQVSVEMVNFSTYKHKLQLFSETKALETIACPNLSITQPLEEANKRFVIDYINEYVNLYSPLVKVAIISNKWAYTKKYTIDSSVNDLFAKVYAPDFSLNAPSLREVLNQLFLTKDMIPYVKDNVIYAMDITARTNTFDTSVGNLSYVNYSMSSDNYVDRLRRGYSQALSSDKSCRYVEKLGFRNNSQSLMTLENLRIETRFPIYKVNKILMCYYKSAQILSSVEWSSSTDYAVGDGVSYNSTLYVCTEAHTSGSSFDSSYWEEYGSTRVFLCKQDITPLVKLNTERNMLSKDFDDMTSTYPTDIDDLATYRMGTVGYDIGSNYITGWGEKYTYYTDDLGWWKVTSTYVENIVRLTNYYTPYGIYTSNFVGRNLPNNFYMYAPDDTISEGLDAIVDGIGLSLSDNAPLKLKTLFFEIDYNGFFNGAVISSKDDANDDITINDNSSSSLAILEKDGLFQKEKANRYGNEALTITATYTSIDDLQPLGSVYGNDIIIYHREYQIYNNLINVVYYGTKDYVLKNYYTSVYAKHRTWSLIDYNESVRRSENYHNYILLSTENSYCDNTEGEFTFENLNYDHPIEALLSFFRPSDNYTTVGLWEDANMLNYGYFIHNNIKYGSDINIFTCGYSLCMNITMYDNVSTGIYIKTMLPFTESTISEYIDTEDDYTGSVQAWYLAVDDTATGATESMTFAFAHVDQTNTYLDNTVFSNDDSEVETIYSENLNLLPKINSDLEENNKISITKDIYKDNKEQLDITFQFEPITNDSKIAFSEWMMKLCDLSTVYNKCDSEYDLTATTTTRAVGTFRYSACDAYSTRLVATNAPIILFEISSDAFSNLEDNATMEPVTLAWDKKQTDFVVSGRTIYKYYLYIYAVDTVGDDYISFKAKQTCYTNTFWNNKKTYVDEITLTLTEVTDTTVATDSDKRYFGFNLNSTSSNPEVITYNGTNEITLSTALTSSDIRRTSNYFNATISGLDESYSSEFLDYEEFTTENSLSLTTYIAESVPADEETIIKNLYIQIGDFDKTIIYDSKTSLDTIYHQDITNFIDLSLLKVNDIFTFEYDEDTNIPYIKVDISDFNGEGVQLWFYDSDEGVYHFVFGVMPDDTDIENGYIKIYTSLITKRKKDVFNSLGKKCGEIHDFSENDEEYGQQIFDED